MRVLDLCDGTGDGVTRLLADDAKGAREVAEAIAPELGWDAAGVDRGVQDFRDEAVLEGLVPAS